MCILLGRCTLIRRRKRRCDGRKRKWRRTLSPTTAVVHIIFIEIVILLTNRQPYTKVLLFFICIYCVFVAVSYKPTTVGYLFEELINCLMNCSSFLCCYLESIKGFFHSRSNSSGICLILFYLISFFFIQKYSNVAYFR